MFESNHIMLSFYFMSCEMTIATPIIQLHLFLHNRIFNFGSLRIELDATYSIERLEIDPTLP